MLAPVRELMMACAMVTCCCGAPALTYPFETSAGGSATLEIQTKQKTRFQPMLLGLNCSWPETLFGMAGYNHPDARRIIRDLHPPVLRWPHGVWANFYDWESDGRRITDNYKTPYDASVKDHPELKYGFDGFNFIHGEMDFDVMFTWNINYDSPEKGVRRLRDRREKGFDVKWIELGNENFWKTQRSDAVSDVQRYIDVSKAHAAALKAADPAIKVSVNITWRDVLTHEWNLAIARETYYDAVSLHRYVEHPETPDGMAKTLAARNEIIECAEAVRMVFPGLPIWLTEWSVDGGENALSVIALADTWLGLVRRSDLFEAASYFQINAKESLIEYNKQDGSFVKTSYGAVFEIVRDVFLGSEILASTGTSPQLAAGLDAVSAEAVVKDGRISIIAVNKSDKAIRLNVILDGSARIPEFSHRALCYDSVGDFKRFESRTTPLAKVSDRTREISLPPLSISRMDEVK